MDHVATCLQALGQSERALPLFRDTLTMNRRLYKGDHPVVAKSLNNQGNRLSDLGRREEALAASQEAVDLYRPLAQTRPDAFLPDLAMSLSNLGRDLWNLGRREEALEHWREAVQINDRLSLTWRNIGYAEAQLSGDDEAALAAYDRAFALDTTDARVLLDADLLEILASRDLVRVLVSLPTPIEAIRRRMRALCGEFATPMEDTAEGLEIAL